MDHLKRLLALEEKNSAATKSQLRESDDADVRAYYLQMQAFDARGCEAQIFSDHKPQPFLQLKSFLVRGRLGDANQKAAEIEKTVAGVPSHEAELLLEKARLAVHEGRWSEAIVLCTAALEKNPILLSRMTLLQVRAHAYSEVGEKSAALLDLNNAETFTTIFPSAQSAFYIKVLLIRLQASLDPQHWERWLELLWNLAPKDQSFNADHLLTLGRAEIEIKRHSGQCFRDAALITLRMADLIGDKLYMALALIDVLSCSDEVTRSKWELRSREDENEFQKIALFNREVHHSSDHQEPLSSTSQSILKQSCGRKHVCVTSESIDAALKANVIFLPRLDSFITLSPWKAQFFERNNQIAKIIGAVQAKANPKNDFFTAVWGITKYVPHLHDPLIWTTLSRFRKKTGLAVKIDSSGIDFGQVLILL